MLAPKPCQFAGMVHDAIITADTLDRRRCQWEIQSPKEVEIHTAVIYKTGNVIYTPLASLLGDSGYN